MKSQDNSELNSCEKKIWARLDKLKQDSKNEWANSKDSCYFRALRQLNSLHESKSDLELEDNSMVDITVTKHFVSINTKKDETLPIISVKSPKYDNHKYAIREATIEKQLSAFKSRRKTDNTYLNKTIDVLNSVTFGSNNSVSPNVNSDQGQKSNVFLKTIL